MNAHSLSRRLAIALAAAGCAVAAPALAATSAHADSIVYAKQGNLFLISPDGSKGYQLTFDGGYSSPSQATNGTIGALHNGQLVRLNRSGQLLNAPIDAMGSPGSGSSAIGGPYEPRISPDGTRFAYDFYVETSFDDIANGIRWINTGSYSTWTYADHFTSPAGESEYLLTFGQPEWLSNDRVIGAQGPYVNIATWKLGTGHGYTWDASQWWFTLQDPPDQYGVAAYHYYSDPALSPDGSKIAMTDGEGDQSDLVLATTNGPAWIGEPPYPEPDYVNMQSDVPAPTLRCQTPTGAYSNPSWSSDSRMLAYGTGDGVHVMTVPATLTCSQVTDRLLVPGGTDPAFGPADVNTAQAPSAAPQTAPQTGQPGSRGVSLRRLSVAPHRFRPVARRSRGSHGGALVRFTLNRAAQVTITVSRNRSVVARSVITGGAGPNKVRFNGWVGRHKLAPGRYALTVSAGSSSARATFQITR
jgi:hypothetical protein